MKTKNSIFLTLAIIVSLSACPLQELRATEVISETLITPHPRVILLKDDVSALRFKMQEDPYLQALNESVIAAADGMIQLNPVEYRKTGRRLLGVARTCLKRVLYLAYSYRITGDRRYLERAEKEMLAVSAFPDWNPSHFLDVAEMTLALGIGYDWLFDDLSSSSRQVIEEAIVQKGLLPSKESLTTWWLNSTNNWNQVCNAGLSVGAWAVYEKYPDLAEEIIGRAQESLQLPYGVYEPDGAYPEGSGYWTYGTTFHILFIDAWERMSWKGGSLDIGEGFLLSGNYYLHVFGPNGSFNYADNGLKSGLSPAICWYAARTGDQSLLYQQEDHLKRFISPGSGPDPGGSSDRLLPMALIWLARCADLKISEPEKLSWTGEGINPVSIHRTSWKEDALFIGIKGGSPSVNHGHMDVGSFVMDAGGIRWAIDLGGHDYHMLEKEGFNLWDGRQEGERWQVFRYNNFGHNTLVINDKLQMVEGNGLIIGTGQDAERKFTIVDISAVYAGELKSARRGIAIVKDAYVVIRDEVKNTGKNSTLRWAMLTHDSVQITDPKTAWIHAGGQKLKFHVAASEEVRIQTFSAQPDLEYESSNPGIILIGFIHKLKKNENFESNVYLIPENTVIDTEHPEAGLSEW